MTAASPQAAFAAALLDPDAPIPPGLTTWNGSDPAQRFAVYRNNVTVSLVDALAATFPVVVELVGEDFFRAAARVFVAAQPPRSPMLARYGDAFPDFLDGFPPAAGLPYLGDVARLERLRVDAHHAADAPALGPDAFAALDPDALERLVVRPHPSARVVQSRFAVFSLWAAHQGVLDIGSVDPWRPEDALVVRPRLDVETIRLPPGAAPLLRRLDDGATLGAAAAAALDAEPAFDPAAALHVLIATGFAADLAFEPGDDP